MGKTSSHMEKLVKQGKWGKIQQMYPLSDPGALIELAEACASSKTGEALMVTLTIFKNSNEQVKMAAARTLGQIGNMRAVSVMRSALRSANPESKELISQLEESISMLDGDKKKKTKKTKDKK